MAVSSVAEFFRSMFRWIAFDAVAVQSCSVGISLVKQLFQLEFICFSWKNECVLLKSSNFKLRMIDNSIRGVDCILTCFGHFGSRHENDKISDSISLQ